MSIETFCNAWKISVGKHSNNKILLLIDLILSPCYIALYICSMLILGE